MKDIAIYFRTTEALVGFMPDNGLKKVKELRQKFIDQKTIFFKDFADPQNFGDLVGEKL